MNQIPITYANNNTQPNKYIFCPFGTCLNIPEIHYLNNPLKTEFEFNCSCQKNKNNNVQLKMDLKSFLENSSYLNCSACMRRLLNEQIIYCIECKTIFDVFCVENHHRIARHSHYIQLNKNIFNFCLDHKSPLIFRCMDCGQSFCSKCNFAYHDEKGHKLEQLKQFSLNQNEFDKIKNAFDRQKLFFEKIKEINKNMIETLENDIQIKERIINNYLVNKSDYISMLNMKNINIQNNEKYENILDDIINKKAENNKEEKSESKSNDFINNYLSTLYYSLMINKEEEINSSLIDVLSKKIININPSINKPDVNEMSMVHRMIEEKNNNYNSIENSKNSSGVSLNSNKNADNNITLNNKYIDSSQMDSLSDVKYDNNMNSQINYQENIKKRIDNINNLNKSHKHNSAHKKPYASTNLLFKSVSSISQTSSEKKPRTKTSRKIKLLNGKKKKNKSQKSSPKKVESKVSSEPQKIISEDTLSKNDNKSKKNNNHINNMILLKSGNIAVSLKEAIEIYNLSQLNFSGACFYDNDIIQNNCLIQRINLVKNRKINYVLELFDTTLLCATYSKIFRIKLTNNDSHYEVISYLKIENSELPTKIISLGNEFLVILTEQKMNCNMKLFQNIAKDTRDKQEQNNSCKNIINNDKNTKIEINSISNNYDDVPAIGNCGLFVSKEIKEDNTFELITKNFNEIRKLWVSIYPIERKPDNDNRNNNEKYLYEFIATSNATYDLGKDKVAFFGIMKNKKEKYSVKKITEIDGLSCSAEADSICQINDKYICVGLQNHNLNGQISGFAFIDINRKEICRIVCDQEISCVCYNPKNNLLFASMEVRDPNKNYFTTKIYEVIKNKGDKGNEEIELKQIYKHRNKHDDIISSVQQLNISCLKANQKEQNVLDNIIFVTSSKDSTLEVVKAEI